MRPLSRLLSVFLALILMGLSVATVSGHADTTTNDPSAASLASVEVVLLSDVETASPGDELEFQVTVLRIADGHEFTATVEGPNSTTDAADPTGADDIAEFTLTDAAPIKQQKVKYTIATGDLGAAVERTASLTWELRISAVVSDGGGEDHTAPTTHAKGSVEVTLVERAAGEASILGIDLDFSPSTAPDSHAKGEKVTFKLVVTTGDTYSLPALSDSDGDGTADYWKTLVVTRQLYDADGDKVGNAIPSAVFQIPTLETGSRSKELKSAPEYHALQTAEADEIAEGGKLVFSYSLTVNEADIRKGAASQDQATGAPDLNKDGNTDGDKIADLKADIDSLTLEMAPEPEPTPSPYLFETEAAKVMELGGGTAIEITRLDTMAEITLTLGTLSSTGALLPRANGYIRDESRGQTYAVVRRDDGEVRRVWISSSSEWVPHIEWANVIAFYNVPSAVLNAIPLDGSMPEAEQLVDVAGDYYVYRDRAWRHIPNLSTFRAEGFRWCDLTTASADFFMREGVSSAATPLASRVGPPAEGYPACGS